MKLSLGIVGLPNVGKSTLFKTITKKEINIANYPFCTIDPNVGIVTVPDERIDKLAELSASKKKIPAVVEFYDIAGLVRGAHKGEGLGNEFLSHIREVNAIVQVLRCFKSSEIIHVDESVDPLRDLETINMELILKDMVTIEKRLDKARTESRSGDKEAKKNVEVLEKVKATLERGELIGEFRDEKIIQELQLLSAKRQLMLLNGKKEDVPEELIKRIEDLGAEYIITDLSETEAIPDLIKSAYKILGLISFFTTGEEETRAWTIKKGAKAPEAAGAIHTDFEKKFIRAETIGTGKLIEAGGWSQAKAKGWLRVEGKDYIVEDGDVLVIRHG
ncbi:MAG: redox-regulated ATPase YchF [Candidatus Harrisonbacteria bacterium CG10_big_fil_rev_8_21_14_0_10_40_38]|uniref:Redox-regulated ATPase YchF n=1 Tax=Candidatus Harrisonbacteria bacterium CG10_big_fil_rev_8_21_14_0_10_40_38 TaxID=1974583 RepID=A0A2H0USK6_9BACT|nr:MAG: redox-regulated ATPase YchF [Candidatus Harrisonbacteria bacterium CG10_big_fil_rev_8_21_14_0_10_40_38]